MHTCKLTREAAPTIKRPLRHCRRLPLCDLQLCGRVQIDLAIVAIRTTRVVVRLRLVPLCALVLTVVALQCIEPGEFMMLACSIRSMHEICDYVIQF